MLVRIKEREQVLDFGQVAFSRSVEQCLELFKLRLSVQPFRHECLQFRHGASCALGGIYWPFFKRSERRPFFALRPFALPPNQSRVDCFIRSITTISSPDRE